ncbi:secretion system protein [Candidatus Saccharibacteria bacterium HGW-Saccharibacteria-1]|jgi:type IV pilus assembly protein PilC|nr:MAG: secretion system protein [Candidatus Saccharibacteria bacterium HGW-Saccharibacteria-1]
MPTFSYIAIDNKGSVVNGSAEQLDRSAVIDAITKQGLRPISISESKAKSDGFDFKNLLGGNKVKSDQLVMFTRQLSAMVGAGVPILRALNALSQHIAESPILKKILVNIIHDMEAGATLGEAFAKYPNTFNDVYVNMVKAGEAAGILDDILKRLAIQQEKSMSMRKKIRSSMAYPIVLLSITVLAFFGLMFFVIPQIGKILTDLGGADAKLPGITLFMLGASNFMIKFWYLIFLVIGGSAYGIARYIKTPAGKFQFHTLILKLPLIKVIVMKVAVAHFARTFSALIEAGVAVLEALSVTSRAVGNVVYEKALLEAEAEVKNGKSLSSVMEKNPLFPPIVPQMLLVGEETGQTEKVLIKVADFYEEEVDTAISGISSIIEPVMIVIMGVMVGLIAASVMLPIASLSQNIK